MSVESILWPLKFGTIIPRMRRWRWTPLTASIVFMIVKNGFFTLRTISIYFVLKKFNQISAIKAFNIESCIKTPVLSIFSLIYLYHILLVSGQVNPIFDSCQIISVLWIIIIYHKNLWYHLPQLSGLSER